MKSKRHVFLTGDPGVGKSTLCQRVIRQTSEMVWAGFYTAELRNEQGERLGFDVVTLDGSRGPLARVGKGRGPSVGKYTVELSSFERLALPALNVSTRRPTLLLVDEIGKMELFSRAFFPAVRAALDSTFLVVLGTIPSQKGARTLREVEEVSAREDVEVLTVTRFNRDALVQEVIVRLQESMRSMQSSDAS
ncbi:hypothetical protein VOLCADRAFT_80686 [Volvox carteri f. nagariensis]|uniref:AAA+ ATPase domain-containing protein n=1 Tax=Volvox carteri f. nagariensis TaxID=3068 RepID=D8TT11_VOLCA|nr:uncharacterized protein VOLCADRAFT_80686 [Volvox carteri f. nagariensis]EFJ49472.1 hypothetical protein VOLCADRAFT_80686 [Volvox carteri f. nagariensis]|eukprot:XP_002949453.1 hypothetical protein VOLCADRAFT_80686 [Volvox carteri f. nagariensis]